MIKTADYNYHLPPERIAQSQVKPRDHSRLLVLGKKNGQIVHEHFFDITKHLQSGDILVVNNSKVFPARLLGKKNGSGGQVEVFLLKNVSQTKWECLLRGRMKIGLEIIIAKNLQAVVVSDNHDGTWLVEFNKKKNELLKIAERIGQVPLPPYIKRSKQDISDKNNYQTTFAKKLGSVAAPTAGLHFTPRLLREIKKMGVEIVEITLHVGLGTFAPVKENDIKDHKMHMEWVEIKKGVIKKIINAKKQGRRIIAVGTTSARSLESLGQKMVGLDNKNNIGLVDDYKEWTNIFIYPGYRFKIVDGLITNFHLPQSTLLMLVSALAGKHHIDKAYKEAISLEYRFFSYGDAMFIV
jgi:S-adenosylmethionine:tRNA ribosyltransferase-isomerase